MISLCNQSFPIIYSLTVNKVAHYHFVFVAYSIVKLYKSLRILYLPNQNYWKIYLDELVELRLRHLLTMMAVQAFNCGWVSILLS